MTHDTPYLNLVHDILANGVEKGDRTGTGMLEVFAPERLRFDMRKGFFPLLTTKRVFWRGVVEELLWFLRGETNSMTLEEKGVNIWREWSDPCTGELGPIYGHNWRRWGKKPSAVRQPTPKLREGLEATFCGVANGAGGGTTMLKSTWMGMIQRCYDASSSGYLNYGARGVSVCDRWLEFRAFEEDVQNLPGWRSKLADPKEYCLDKDGRGNGFVYSPENCQWITRTENIRLQHADTTYVVRRISDGELFQFSCLPEFADEQGFNHSNFADLWNKGASVRNGFELVEVIPPFQGVDQIRVACETLKNNPNCRRNIVHAWNVSHLDMMSLPPCHLMFQLNVCNGHLNLHMTQRSADVFLGLPWNISSYALLTHILANHADLRPGVLTISIGSAHIYLNHLDQMRTQIQREPRLSPSLRIVESRKWPWEHEAADFELAGYDPWPTIKGEVSV